MGGGSAHAGFAPKRWLLTWSYLTPVLQQKFWICDIFQVSSREHETRCEGQGQAAQVGGWVRPLSMGRGTKPPNKG